MSKSTVITVIESGDVRKSKSGNEFQVLQCVVTYEGGKKVVGRMQVFGEIAKTPIPAGDYMPEYEVAIGFGEKNRGDLEARMTLIPLRAPSSKAAA